MKKTRYALIVAFAVFLNFILDHFNFQLKNTIPLIIIVLTDICYSKHFNYKKNSWIFIIILLLLVFIFQIIINNNNLGYITFNKISDGLIISILLFLILNRFIYE